MHPEIQVNMASILSVPFVVRVKILCKLTTQEQLVLRQVCKTMKDWIDTSSLVHHVPATIIEDNGSKTFTKFLQKRPPHVITKLHIENESCDFLHDPALEYFLYLHSSTIKKLSMRRYFTCGTMGELKFYESFVNLEELELHKISIPTQHVVSSLFPKSFKELRVLKIGDVKAFPEPPDDSFGSTLIPLDLQRPMGLYVWKLIGFCEKIEHLGYPNTAKYFFQAFVDGRGRGEFGMFCDYIRNRSMEAPEKPNLKFCDFLNDNWPPDSRNTLTLLKLGNEFGVQYLNVNANQFNFLRISSLIKMYDLPKNASDCINSFKNFNCLITEQLPKVQRVCLKASDVNSMLDYSCVFNGSKVFPGLQEIEIVVDVGFSENYQAEDIYIKAATLRGVRTLLSHFFYDMELILSDEEAVRDYTSVSDLTISFKDLPPNPKKWKATPKDLPMEWIMKALPNLRRLKIVGWAAEHTSYLTLWKGFPRLEELLIEDCENLTDNCFFGDSEHKSAFQELKQLRRLTFMLTKKGDDKIYGLTKRTIQMFQEDMGLLPSIFLNQCSQKSSIQMTWSK
ncbi:hypothetical protein Ocin01_12553 [Orchesella cincta]|uniref:F-box domain-containing protein n=1 Tax=Orchesella cincta TaxID=48709 RepID=A0A1D2MMA4_ORCCI|nr:hypothetical protein Ocin01_12553 [Orchesella cincta]